MIPRVSVNLFALSMGVLQLFVALGHSAVSLPLVEDGKSRYSIVLANDAIPAERTAAEQLQKYIYEVTGKKLEIKDEKVSSSSSPQILVGAGERVKKLLPKQDWEKLGQDGIVIKTVGDDLILAGGRPRGALYAVFQFLEDEVGCRWWTPTESTIPQRKTISINEQDIVYSPAFTYRSHYTTSLEDPVFATILRENGLHQKQLEDWGGHYNIIGSVHTFFRLLPPEQYFNEHPEWFSDSANGNRPSTHESTMPTVANSQLCLSNPEVVKAATEQALEWIKQDPTAGYISISENDNGNYCECEKCALLAEREGSQSGPIVTFVNQIAAKIHEQYPDFLVETLAYRGSVKPPKTVRPADNVLIRFAPLQADFGHPMDSDWNGAGPGAKENVRDGIREWAKISKQLFVWNYVTNFLFTMLPYPNWDGLAKDLRFFANNKVTGIFEQGDNFTNEVGDFVKLRAWLIGKLMWNPELDQDKLMEEFLNGYYGAAGPYLKKYIDLMQKSFLASNERLSSFQHFNHYSFLNLDTMNEAQKLFDQAEASVKNDPVLAERLERDRISHELAWIYRYNALKQVAASQKRSFLGPVDPEKFVEYVDAKSHKYNVANFMEQWDGTGKFSEEVLRLKEMFGEGGPIPKIILDQVPERERISRIIDLQPRDFQLVKEGVWTSVVDDPASGSGRALRLEGSTLEWIVYYQLNNYGAEFLSDDKWTVYVVARFDTVDDSQSGLALQGGIYNDKLAEKLNDGTVVQAKVDRSNISGGGYQILDLGTSKIPAGSYLWLAPANNPTVKAIYIERIILVKKG